MERPTGVTILSVLNFIGAAGCLLFAILFFLGGAMLGSILGSATSSGGASASGMAGIMAALGAAVGVVMIFFGGLCLLLGIGLWKLRNWARVIEIVLLIIGVLFGVLGLVGMLAHIDPVQIVIQLIIVALYAWILMYLFKPHVKQAFGAS